MPGMTEAAEAVADTLAEFYVDASTESDEAAETASAALIAAAQGFRNADPDFDVRAFLGRCGMAECRLQLTMDRLDDAAGRGPKP